VVLIAVFLVCWTPSSATGETGPTEDIKAEQMFQDYHEAFLALHPRMATSLGDHRYDDRFENDISDAYREQLKLTLESFREQASEIRADALTEENRFSLLVFQYMVQTELDGLVFPEHLLPMDQMNCLPADFAQWGAGESAHPFRTVTDYDNFLKRIDGLESWVNTAMENMDKGIRMKVVLPRLIVTRTIQRLKPLLVEEPEDSEFYRPVRNMPGAFSAEDRERLTAAYTMAIRDRILPTYRKLVHFLETAYLPHCRDTLAWTALPDGTAWYAYRVRTFTTTALTPETVYKLGQQETERIVGEYLEATRTPPSRRPIALCRTDKQLVHAYEKLMDRILPELEPLFGITISTPLEIRTTDRVSHYKPGAWDGSRPGIFYAQAGNLSEHPAVVSEPLFLHEALPGHHFQLSVQRESSLPPLRRYAYYGAYIEGWALYVERLGSQLGVYRDPRQRLWQLQSELWRAIRLMLDVGIHVGGWSVEDALAHIRPYGYGPGMTSEIERYAAWPGQALTYKIGELKILDLRRKAEQALGDHFDPAEFHRAILLTGPVPLHLLEYRIDRWIASKRTGSEQTP